jgi:hypothetical protein
MTIPADVMPFVLMASGVVFIFVGFVWLQDELDMPNKRTWLVYDLIVSGEPFAFMLVGMMGLGVVLAYLGWKSLP